MTIDLIGSLAEIWLAVPSPDGRRILTSPMESGTCLYTADTLEEVSELDIHGRRICFSPDSEKFAFSYQNSIYVYDMLLDDITTVIRTHKYDHGGQAMCFSGDSGKLIKLQYTHKSVSYISVYNVETGVEENRFFENERCVFNEIWYSRSENRYLIDGFRRLNFSGHNEYLRFWFDLDGKFDIIFRSEKRTPFVNVEGCFVQNDSDTKQPSIAEMEELRSELIGLLPSKKITSFYVFANLSKLLVVAEGKLSIYAIT